MKDFPTFVIVSTYIFVFAYGIVIGSFANVLACRIPRKESFVAKRSHCENCGYELQWYDLIPVLSYIFLRGRCRKCKAKISVQHLLVEVLNGLLYVMLLTRFGLSLDLLFFCLTTSALLALSIIDFRTYEIPVGFNYFIFFIGVIRLLFHLGDWKLYLVGFLSVSVFLYLLYIISKGTAIGGGDVKLMAVCGLLLGWKLVLLAFIVGCILGSVIHSIRIKMSGEGHVLAMGPYLSAGVLIATLWGEKFITWYAGLFAF